MSCYFPIGILGQVWYLIVSIPDLCRLSYFVLASHRYCSTHCVDVVDIWEKKKAELQKIPLPRAVFLEGVKRSQYQCIIWKTLSVIILTNQCLTIMVRSRTVINIVPFGPPPWKKFDTPPPPLEKIGPPLDPW